MEAHTAKSLPELLDQSLQLMGASGNVRYPCPRGNGCSTFNEKFGCFDDNNGAAGKFALDCSFGNLDLLGTGDDTVTGYSTVASDRAFRGHPMSADRPCFVCRRCKAGAVTLVRFSLHGASCDMQMRKLNVHDNFDNTLLDLCDTICHDPTSPKLLLEKAGMSVDILGDTWGLCMV